MLKKLFTALAAAIAISGCSDNRVGTVDTHRLGRSAGEEPVKVIAPESGANDFGIVEFDHPMIHVPDPEASVAYLKQLGFRALTVGYIDNGPFFGGATAFELLGKTSALEVISIVDADCSPKSMEFTKAGYGPAAMVVLAADDTAYHDAMREAGYQMHAPFAAGDRVSYLPAECREKIGDKALAEFTDSFSPTMPYFGQAPFNFHIYSQEKPGVWDIPDIFTQFHPNTASAVSAVFAISDDLEADIRRQVAMWQMPAEVWADGAAIIPTDSIDLHVLTSEAVERRFSGFSSGDALLPGDTPRPMIGVQIIVRNLDKVERRLRKQSIAFGKNEFGIFVLPEETMNTLFEFVEVEGV